MRSGIRRQIPEADEDQVNKILGDRLDRLTKVEEMGIFEPAKPQ